MVTEATGFQLEEHAAERYERFVAPIMAPFVAAAVEALRLEPGMSVLDLACGTGFAARAAAARVGPSGRVACTDVNAAMLAVAARVAGGAARFDWWKAPADHLPFGDAEFDAVVCQQSAQFFPDLAAATGEAARVLRPGGRVAVTVWSPLDRSPYFAAQYEAICEVAGVDDVPSLAAAFGYPVERITGALTAAGLHDVEAREVVVDISLPPLGAFAARHLEAIPWGAAAAAARPDGLEAVAARMAERLASRLDGGGAGSMPFASQLVTATR